MPKQQLSRLLAISVATILILSAGLQGFALAQGIEDGQPETEAGGSLVFDPADTGSEGDDGEDGQPAPEAGDGASEPQGDEGQAGETGHEPGDPGESDDPADGPEEGSGDPEADDPEPGDTEPADPETEPGDDQGDPDPGSQDPGTDDPNEGENDDDQGDPADPEPGDEPEDPNVDDPEAGDPEDETGDEIPVADTSALEELVTQAEALDDEAYTEESWANLAAALASAQDILADEDASQDVIDDAASALQAALDALEDAEPLQPEPSAENPALDIFVEANPSAYEASDTAKFIIRVVNSGDVALGNLKVTDDLTGLDQEIISLPIDHTETIHVRYPIPEDFDADELEYTAAVSGSYTPAEGDPIGLRASDTVQVTVLPLDFDWEEEIDDYVLIPPSPAHAELYPNSFAKRAFGINSFPEIDEHGNIVNSNDPGFLALTKGIVEDIADNQWKIELTVTGKGRQKPDVTSDIVLVVDCSGSMNDPVGNGQSRLDVAKLAAKAFVDEVLTADSTEFTRVALVSYNRYTSTRTGITEHHQLTDNPGTNNQILKNKIDNLSATGGTFTQGGLRRGATLLQGSNATYRTIVLLSDGKPTASYKWKNHDSSYRNSDNFYQDEDTGYWYSRPDIPASFFDYETPDSHGKQVGDGSNLTHQIGSSDYYYHHGNQAISEAAIIKGKGIEIFTVGVDMTGDEAVGVDIMRDIASSPGQAYDTNSDTLEDVLTDVAGRVGGFTSPATNAVVTDPMGEHFSIPGITSANYASKITVSPGTSVSWNDSTNTITWTIGEMAHGVTYKMSYTVEIADDAPPGTHPTNKETPINYTNIEGDENAVKLFPIPDVEVAIKVVKLTIQKLVTGTVDPGKEFSIFIQGDEHKWAVRLAANESVTLELPLGDYTIHEVVPMHYTAAYSANAFTLTEDYIDTPYQVTVTNDKDSGGWFHDDDEKVNEFPGVTIAD